MRQHCGPTQTGFTSYLAFRTNACERWHEANSLNVSFASPIFQWPLGILALLARSKRCVLLMLLSTVVCALPLATHGFPVRWHFQKDILVCHEKILKSTCWFPRVYLQESKSDSNTAVSAVCAFHFFRDFACSPDAVNMAVGSWCFQMSRESSKRLKGYHLIRVYTSYLFIATLSMLSSEA